MITIGARTYTVVYATELEDETLKSNPKAYGYADHSASKIVIKKTECETFMKENLMHEIIHAISENAGISLSEDIIRILAPRMHEFLVRNKNFINEIQE